MWRIALIVAVVATAALAIWAGVSLWRHTRLATLTSAELEPKHRVPLTADELARRIRFSQVEQQPAGCPEVAQVLALSRPPSGSAHEKPVRSASPLGRDQIAIYRAVLEEWRLRGWASLHVSARSHPLDATGMGSRLLNCECLQGIYVDASSDAFHSFHELTPSVVQGNKMMLVDPERQAAIVRANDPDRMIGQGKTVHEAVRDAESSGLFSMSEIAFDQEHHHAIVSYSYWCGGLCGQGATLVFEKVGGTWKATKRQCGGWIS